MCTTNVFFAFILVLQKDKKGHNKFKISSVSLEEQFYQLCPLMFTLSRNQLLNARQKFARFKAFKECAVPIFAAKY